MGWEAGRLSEITVLFADCRGYTEMTQAVGPERVSQLMDRFFRAAYGVVVKHDGIVDKFMGDGCLALFNAPVRHEDHAMRAVLAARELHEVAGQIDAEAGMDTPLNIGVTVNTGFAVTMRVGSNHASDYTAVGDVVNLAARLQAGAGAGETLLCESTYREVREAFPAARQKTLQLKGYSKPATAYLVPGGTA